MHVFLQAGEYTLEFLDPFFLCVLERTGCIADYLSSVCVCVLCVAA